MKIILINYDLSESSVDIIDVSEGFIEEKLPQWLVDNGIYDSLSEVPTDGDELIRHFVVDYCNYPEAGLTWEVCDCPVKVNRLTINNF